MHRLGNSFGCLPRPLDRLLFLETVLEKLIVVDLGCHTRRIDDIKGDRVTVAARDGYILLTAHTTGFVRHLADRPDCVPNPIPDDPVGKRRFAGIGRAIDPNATGPLPKERLKDSGDPLFCTN